MQLINNTYAGYRLEYLQVFNWGTFDAGRLIKWMRNLKRWKIKLKGVFNPKTVH